MRDTCAQETIRDALRGSTLITIAHRLNTIIDYDTIALLDGGQIVEHGPPAALLERCSQ